MGHDSRTHRATESFSSAVNAARAGDGVTAGCLVQALSGQPRHEVATAVVDLLERQVAAAWAGGWQPADLHRFVTRRLGNDEAHVLRQAIAAQARGYARLGERVAPHWMAQLVGIDASPPPAARRSDPDPGGPYLLQLTSPWPAVLRAAVSVMSLLLTLPELPHLTPPPSSWRNDGVASPGTLPPGILEKVRALLAKAEKTPFEAEADAFTAKAQELMARHRIDRAVLSASHRAADAEPVGRRIGVDDPYADAKALLLGAIADANGCRAVWSKALGFSTVFGFEDELAAVDELFTSLLVQATAALRREGSKYDLYGRSRTRRFRRSFLVAFAIRIGDRLRDAVDATVQTATAESGTALVPILAAREDATAAAAQAAFPNLTSFAPSITDREGWQAGTLLGDRASLALGPQIAAPGR